MAMHMTVERTAHTTAEEVIRLVAPALAACATREQRVQRALELLAGAAAVENVELYLIGPAGIALAAATAEGLSDPSRLPSLARMLDVDGDSDATMETAALAMPAPAQADGSPTNAWPLLLACVRGATAVAGSPCFISTPRLPYACRSSSRARWPRR